MKKFRLKLFLRLSAILDVIVSEKFELTTWDKKGRQTSKTKFCKTDINNLK